MKQENNEILDKICARLDEYPYLKTNSHDMRGTGYYSVQIDVDVNNFATSVPYLLEQLTGMIHSKVLSVMSTNTNPVRYKTSYGDQQFQWVVQSNASKNLDGILLIGPSHFARLSVLLGHEINSLSTNVEQIYELDQVKRVIFLAERVTVKFEDFKFVDNKISINFSIDLPSINLYLSVC